MRRAHVDAVPGAGGLAVVAQVRVLLAARPRPGHGQPQHGARAVQIVLRQSDLRGEDI